MHPADRNSTTRRALFAAAPALAAGAVPTLAVATDGQQEDAELIRLGQEWSRLKAEEAVLEGEVDRIWQQSLDLPAPGAFYHRRGVDRLWFSISGDFSKPADEWAVGEWRSQLTRAHTVTSADQIERIHARAREIVAAADAHKEAQAQLRKQLGGDALHERMRETMARIEELEAQILQLEARTLPGVAVKARLVECYPDIEEPGTYGAHVLASLMRDLRPFAGGVPS
jgi:hypothetical protein